MRTFIAVLIFAVVIAPASFAQQVPIESQASNESPTQTESAAPEAPAPSPQQAPSPPSAKEPAVAKQEPIDVRVPGRVRVAVESLPIVKLDEGEKTPEDITWFEKWAWLVGFFILAVAAMRLGFRDLSKSIALEKDEADARSFQKMIEDGNATTENEEKLGAFIEAHAATQQAPSKNPFVQLFRLRKLWLLGIGGLILLVLAMAPDDMVRWGFRFKVAKVAAWEVLNTDFAGAFAVTWIALLFFWGLQSRRLVEAESKIRIAVNEARRTLRVAHKEAFSDYEEVASVVVHQILEPPARKLSTEGSGNDEAVVHRYEEDVSLIKAGAITLAVGKPLTGGEKLEAIQTETERLRLLAPPTIFVPGFMSRSLVDFVRKLRDRKRLPEGEIGQLWSAFADSNSKSVADAVAQLATKLRTK